MVSETFISADFIRHEPLLVHMVSPHLNQLNNHHLQSRYVRRHGLVMECAGGLHSDSTIRMGENVEVSLQLFSHQEPIRILAVVDMLIPFCKGAKGEVLGLIGLKYLYLPTLVSQKLEAHELLIQTDLGLHRSVRLPVNLPVEVKGVEVFSHLRILDLSMTGIFVSTRVKPNPGKVIQLFFRLPFQKENIVVEGRVVWNGQKGEPNGFGVEFVDLGAEARFQLAHYIAKNLVFPNY